MKVHPHFGLPLTALAALTSFLPAAQADWVVSGGGNIATLEAGGTATVPEVSNQRPFNTYLQNGGTVTGGASGFGFYFSPVTYTMNGGTFTLTSGSLDMGNQSTGWFTQNGGLVTVPDVIIRVSTGQYVLTSGTMVAGSVRFGGDYYNHGNFFLSGGTLVTSQIGLAGSGSFADYFNFNGGVLQANASVASPGTGWMNSAVRGVIYSGGAIFDTNGTDRNIYSSIRSDNGFDGGLTKLGEGTLTLFNTLSYVGTTTVQAGTLQLSTDPGYAYANGQMIGRGALVVNGGTFALGAYNESIGSLSGAGGTVNLNGKHLVLTQVISGTYAGNITGTNGALIKSGEGLLKLSGTNTYTRGTTVGAGTLQFATPSAVPAAGLLLVSSGATGAFNFGGAGEFTWSGVSGLLNAGFSGGSFVGLDTTNASGGSAALSSSIADSINGTLGFTKLGTGTLVLSGTNTYTGGTRVTEGTLQFARTSALSSTGTLTVNAGATAAFNVGGAGEFTGAGISGNTAGFQNGSWLGVDTTNAGGSATVSNTLAGSFGLKKIGTGTLVLSGSHSFTGGLRVNGGLVQFANVNNLGAVSGTIALDGGGLRWATGNTADVSARIHLGAGGGTIETNGTFLDAVTLANAISGTGALTKTGTGFLRLTSANSHSGDTTVNGGVIILAGGTSTRGQLGGLDGSRITINSGNINLERDNALVGTTPHANILLTINTGGLLSTENNVTILPEVVLDGGYIETASAGNFVTGNYTFTDGVSTAGTGKTSYIMGGVVVMPTAVTVGVGDTLRIGSIIMGNNNLVKHGAGALVLTGSNTFAGSALVNGGLIEFANASAFGNAANKITLNGGGLRWATGNTADISGRLNAFGTGGATFDTNGNFVTLATAMSGSGALTKTGAGTLRLTAANSYSGGTVITGGQITVSNHNALGSGVVQITGAGALYVEDAMAFTNDVVLSGGSYSRAVSGSLAGKVNSRSDLVGGIDTTARILGGSILTTSTLITSFSGTSAAMNDSLRESDVYSFLGTGANAFVLELGSASLDGGTLGWLSNGLWVNAIDGNSNNTATAAMQGFEGSYDEFLAAFGGVGLSQSMGAFGYDQETHSAWAVLNHNSDFAVIPEPATVAMLVLGGVAMLARRRRS